MQRCRRYMYGAMVAGPWAATAAMWNTALPLPQRPLAAGFKVAANGGVRCRTARSGKGLLGRRDAIKRRRRRRQQHAATGSFNQKLLQLDRRAVLENNFQPLGAAVREHVQFARQGLTLLDGKRLSGRHSL